MSKFIFAGAFLLLPAFAQNSAYPAFNWIKEVDSSGTDTLAGMGVDALGDTYLAGSILTGGLAHQVYVTKLDPAGNIDYSKQLGGSGDDLAVAMAVDRSGDLYVTGTTTSTDFPLTNGAYSSSSAGASSGTSFLFKLNPDGSTAYSTYFSFAAHPAAIVVDAAGSAYVSGWARDGLPVTQGTYQDQCTCGPQSNGFFTTISNSGFVTKFNPSGSGLAYSTYIELGQLGPILSAMALGADGSVYAGGDYGLDHLDPTGTQLLSHVSSAVKPQAMLVAADGSLYLAGQWKTPLQGSSQGFQTTPGAFEPNPEPFTTGLTVNLILKMDSQLTGITASTFFGGPRMGVTSMAFDQAGNVYLGGGTGPQGLPTRTPIQGGFFSSTGFVSELSADLTSLKFSSYFGDLEIFEVGGIGIGPDGSLLLGGVTGGGPVPDSGPQNLWANSVNLTSSSSLRIDAVLNAATMNDGPISAGETIVVKGAGFAAGTQISIGGTAVTPISTTSTAMTATLPANLPTVAAEVMVGSGGAVSNQILMPVAATSPGIFTQDGTGAGTAYIVNQGGTLNSQSNPVRPGQQITIYATGVGPVSFSGGFAVTQFPVNVFIEGFYCDGVAAVMGPAQGFPGNVYQITVIVPDPTKFSTDLANYKYPEPANISMQIDGVTSPAGPKIWISQ